MKIILWIVLGLAGFLMLVTLVGWLLPNEHVITRVARFHQKPEMIWKAITDIEAMPTWRQGLRGVKRLPEVNGLPAWVEQTSAGDILLETTESDPPRRMVSRIADPKLPFGGSWTYEIRPAAEGATLRITENGFVTNPLFRFLSRFVFGHAATMETHLKSLAKKFGEEPYFGE
jgi:uncharacterized protein YndB with AHSA1/START domain